MAKPNPYEGEVIIQLPNGDTLRCGSGEEHRYGGYIRVCNAAGKELKYWDKEEWREEPESVIGAVFGYVQKRADRVPTEAEHLTARRSNRGWI